MIVKVSKVDEQPSILTSSGASDSPEAQPAPEVKKLRNVRAATLAEPIPTPGKSIELDTAPA